jgi:hypothetical protein
VTFRAGRGVNFAVVVLLAALVACSSGPADPRVDPGETAWLCRPGMAGNPCTMALDITSLPAKGTPTVRRLRAASKTRFDCFYVYPTVSVEHSTNADTAAGLLEITSAVAQASPFSQLCRVWAPLYRQRTVVSFNEGLASYPAADVVAFESVLSAWQEYLSRFNDGRPIIFIGHSQGAAMLIRLLATEIDNSPSLRKRMVSAILPGANVTVKEGSDVGGSFQRIPACRTPGQTRCVLAYSAYFEQPPPNSLFGRPGQGVSFLSNQNISAGQRVVCTNPANLAGTVAPLLPQFHAGSLAVSVTAASTPWVEFPDLYTAECQSAGGATWLQVNDVGGTADPRPPVAEIAGPEWGLHSVDVNLALGNLLKLVAQQEAAYR